MDEKTLSKFEQKRKEKIENMLFCFLNIIQPLQVAILFVAAICNSGFFAFFNIVIKIKGSFMDCNTCI